MKISVLLELLTADFETDSKRAEKLFEKAVEGMAATAARAGAVIGAGLATAATALGGLALSAAQTADQLNDASARTGLAVEQLSRLKYAAEQSGSSFEDIEKGLQKLSKEADNGGQNLARLGISVLDTNGRLKSSNDLFLEAADKISRMGNATERSAAAQAVFGRAGLALLPVLQEGKAGIAALGDEAEALGVVFSGDMASASAQVFDNLDKLKTAAVGLGNDVATELLPVVVDLTNAFVEFVKQAREDGTIKAWIDGFKELLGMMDEVAVFLVTRLALGALPAVSGAMTASLSATTALRLGLALLGGPVGLLATVLAGLAVAVYNHESAVDDLRDANDKLKESTEALKSAQGGAIEPMLQAALAAQEEAKSKLKLAEADLAAAEAKAEFVRQSMEQNKNPLVAAMSTSALNTTLADSANRIRELRGEVDRARQAFDESDNAIDDAKKRLAEWREELKDSGEAAVTLGASAADLAKDQKAAAASAKDAAQAQREFAAAMLASQREAYEAVGDLDQYVARLSAQLSGPAAMAALDYADALKQIARWQEAILALGPPTAASDAQIARARELAAEAYRADLEDIAGRERGRIDDARDQAAEYGQVWSQAYDQMSYLFRDVLAGNIDSFDDFADALSDIWQNALLDMIQAEIRANLGGNGGGASGGGFGQMLGGLFGGSGGGGGNPFSGILSGLFGGGGGSTLGMTQNAAGAAGGMFGGAGFGLVGGTGGGASAMGGAMGFMGQAAPWAVGLHGVRTGNVGQGLVGGAMAGMQVGGPWGALVGAIIGGLGAALNKPKPPDFRLGGSSSNVRKPEGDFDTVFGNVRAGSRIISWESLVKPVQDFDVTIRDMVASFGYGQEQMDEIAAALSRWSVDLKDDAATAENVLGSRFSAILSTFNDDIREFVGTAGTVQERVASLADALSIQAAVDDGQLGDSFDSVASLLEDYRAQNEDLATTYARVLGSVTLLDEALALTGVTLTGTRDEIIRFAADFVEAAGGLEQARNLWAGFYAGFYSDQERALANLNTARGGASTAFAAIGLNVGDFTGEGGMAAFRALFEQMLPTLSAEATVSWLEAANALSSVVGLTAQYAQYLTETADNLGEFMSGVDAQLADLQPDASLDERIAQQRAANEELLARAVELGATEEQIARVRELGAIRLNALLEEQNALIAEQVELVAQQQAAAGELSEFLASLGAQAAEGVTPMTSRLQELNDQYRSNIDTIERLARESGRAGASQEELAYATALYRQQLAAFAAELVASAQDLVSRLYGGRPTGAAGGATGGGATWVGGGGSGSEVGAVGAVQDAVEDRYAREMQLLQNLSDYLDSLSLSDLSPLTPAERLMEARSTYEDLLSRAQGGDLDALEQLQGAAQAYLSEARGFSGGVGGYRDIFEGVQSALRALVDRGPLNSPPVPGDPGTGGGSGGGGGGPVTVEPGDGFVELSAAEREALAQELAVVLRDLMAATGESLLTISEQLGIDLVQFVRDLGVDLGEISTTTAIQLADISRTLGVDLADLATSVGVELGDLTDEQSLLNDALEQTINELAPEIRDQLRGYLTAIENATNAADANEAIAQMEAAILGMSPELQALLAPYLEGISSPTNSLLDVTLEMANDIGQLPGLLTDILAALDPLPPDPELPPPDPAVSKTASSVVDMSEYRRDSEALKKELARGARQNEKLLAELVEVNRQISSKMNQNAATRRG